MMNVNKKVLCSLLALILVFSALLPVSALAASKESPITVARTAVVRVLAIYGDGSFGTGSGFGVGKLNSEPEYFITNAHVCLDEDGNPAESIYLLLESRAAQLAFDKKGNVVDVDLNNAMTVSCDIVNRREMSMTPDVAVLRAEKPVSGRTCLPLRESGEVVEAPQIVYALGFPGDLDVVASSNNDDLLTADIDKVNITQGVVSQKTQFMNTNAIMHSAEISHGNSGGPLVDEKGAVVGINTYSLSGGLHTDVDHYFAIYIDYAIDVLKANGIDYATYKATLDLKTIILCAAIVGIIAIAAIMLAGFSKKEKKLVKEEKGELRLQGMAGAFAGRRFPIDNQVTLGRAPSNNIVFPTSTEGVSGNHCVVINNNGQLYVKDTSTYGTFVNGTNRLPKDQLVSVKVGDKISLGSENQSFIITRKGGKI